MTSNQTKAKEILKKSSLRPYGRRVDVFIYDLSSPLKNGDCNDTFSDSLGNIIAYLLNASNNFIDFPVIDDKIIRQICYNRNKTITITKKKTNQRLKVVFKSHPVKIVNWPKDESNLWN